MTRVAPGSVARVNPGTRLAPGARAFVSSQSYVRVHRHERGPRVYLAGRRVHHGPAFTILAAFAWRLRRYRIATACALWAATDYRDFPFRDHNNH